MRWSFEGLVILRGRRASRHALDFLEPYPTYIQVVFWKRRGVYEGSCLHRCRGRVSREKEVRTQSRMTTMAASATFPGFHLASATSTDAVRRVAISSSDFSCERTEPFSIAMADSGPCKFSRKGLSTNAASNSTFWHLRSPAPSRSHTDQKQISGGSLDHDEAAVRRHPPPLHPGLGGNTVPKAACTSNMGFGFQWLSSPVPCRQDLPSISVSTASNVELDRERETLRWGMSPARTPPRDRSKSPTTEASK